MPFWIPAAVSGVAGFFRNRPVMILYTLIMAGIIAFWFHYRGLIKDLDDEKLNNAALELSLQTQKGATDAVKKRAEEIAQDLARFGDTIEALEEVGRNVRAENRRLRRRLDSLELDVLVETQPDVAADTATHELNQYFWLLECETNPNRIKPCGIDGEDFAGASPP